MDARVRTVTRTILFTDMVDSTATLERLGIEEWQRVVGTHRSLLEQATLSHAGEVVKWLGDGIMATFGSATDAVHCAIAIQRAADQVTRHPVSIRVGLEVGDIGFQGDDYVGTSIVVAERLCKQAAGGQILGSVLVAGLLQRQQAFEFRPVGNLDLKGISEPVAAVEVVYTRRSGLALLTGSPFVGRGQELRALRRRFEAAEQGHGGLVLLAGEAGIGKTRMAEELGRAAVERGARVLWGHCFEGNWAPAFGPFAEAVNEFARSSSTGELEASVGLGAGPLRRLAPVVRERLPDVPEPPPLQPDEERFRLLDAVTQFFLQLASKQPVLLALDDLHWADRGSVVMLRHLARFAPAARLLIVGTYRDVEVGREHPLAEALGGLYRETSFERIDLRGLATDEVGELLAQVGDEQPPRDLVATLCAETDGNPFFLREILLQLVNDGALWDDEGNWAARVATPAGLPESVRQTLGRRLERLSPGAHRLLQAASGFDGLFDFAVAARVAGLEEAEALDALDEAIEARLARPVGAGEAHDFMHALIRQALYDQLTAARRTRLHRQIAEAIEQIHGGRLEEYAAALVYQYRRSASVAGAERGVEHAIRAADRAEALYAREDAAVFLRGALELMPAADPRRREVLKRLAVALAWALELEAAADVAVSAAEAIVQEEGPPVAADYLATVAGTLVRAGDMRGAWRLAERGLALCGEERGLTWAYLRAYDLQRREAEDPNSPGIPLDTAERREVARILFSATPTARGWLASTGFAWFETRKDVLEQGDPLALTLWGGEFRRSRELWRERAERAEAHGQIARAVSGWAHLSRCHIALGEFEQARGAYERGEALSRRLPPGTTQALNLAAVRLEMVISQGRGWEVLLGDVFGPLLRQATRELDWTMAGIRAACAAAYAWLGQRERAFHWLGTLLDPLERASGWAPNYTTTAVLAGEVHWQLEHSQHLSTIERNLRTKVVNPDFRTPMLDGRLAVARLCALDGRQEEAVNWFAAAREVLGEQGARPLLAIVDFDEGLSYLRRGESGDAQRARPLLEAAHEQFDGLGMAGWLERCGALLRSHAR